MSHVFIAYKREDKTFAKEVRIQLGNAGIKSWMDEDIAPSRKWREEIDDKLRESYALVLVLTDEAISSIYVQYEWMFALGMGIDIFPIRVRKLHNLRPYRLDDIQDIDFTEEYKWQSLIENLLESKSNNLSIKYRYIAEKKDEALNGANENIRKRAIIDIEKSELTIVPDVLAEVIEESHLADVRQYAGIVLARVSNNEDARALPALFEALKKNTHYKSQASPAIKKYGELAISGLIDCLSSDDNTKAGIKSTMSIIREMKIDSAEPKLLEYLYSENPEFWDWSALTLSGLDNTQDIVPRLNELILDHNYFEPLLIQALASYKDTRSIHALMQVIKESDHSSLVLQTLADFDALIISELLDALVGMHCNEDTSLRYESLFWLIVQLRTHDFVEPLSELLKCEVAYIRHRVPEPLAVSGGELVIDLIGHYLLNDEDHIMRRSCASALGLIESDKVIDYLYRAISNENIGVQASAVQALGYEPTPKRISALADCLRHPAIVVHGNALQELQHIDHEIARQALKDWERHQLANGHES